MNLAFSTLGCPTWDFDDICATAKDLGYDAVEIRGVAKEMYAPNIKVFNENYVQKTIKKLDKTGLKISMLTSGASLAVHSEKETAVKEAKDYIDLAEKLNVPYIRVMCTNQPQPDGGDIELCKRLYAEICEYAQGKNVIPLIETNGILADSKVMREFLDEVGVGGALWDINHPYRFMGEPIEETVKNLGNYIKYVHIKDSIVQNGQTKYKMLGYGDIPIKKAIESLLSIGYSGTFSFEWVKRWNKDLEEPGIVFSHFINYIRSLKLNN